MKKLLGKIAGVLSEMWIIPLCFVSGRNIYTEKAVLRPVVRKFSRASRMNYYKYAQYPKDISIIYDGQKGKWKNGGVAIVFQGPIEYREDFTLRTIELYRAIYPNIGIIVSTWKGTVRQNFRDAVHAWHVDIIESEGPSNPGYANVNMQLVSSLAGIKQAKGRGYSFVLKHRADIRFYNPDFLIYFQNACDAYPALDRICDSRLVYLSYNSYLKLPFYLRDFCVYGSTLEMERFYGIRLDERRRDYMGSQISQFAEFMDIMYQVEVGRKSTDEIAHTFWEDYRRFMSPENYLVSTYYSQCIRELTSQSDLWQEYEEYLKKYAVIIDCEPLQMYWTGHGEAFMNLPSCWDQGGKLNAARWYTLYGRNG